MIARTLAFPVPLLLSSALSPPLAAQRPAFEHQKRASQIDFGTVSLGTHSLAELPVGNSWRLGASQSTVWSLTMPAISGTTVIAPGSYVVQLHRTAEETCALVPAGSGKALGAGNDLRVEGPLSKSSKPSKKLTIDWVKDTGRDGKPPPGAQPAKLTVLFGADQWDASVLFPGNKTFNVTGGKLVVFALPAELMATREPAVPVAVLTKGDDSWNLVVGTDEARLVPWIASTPSTRDAPSLDESRVTKGTVEAADVKPVAALDVVEATAASVSKGELLVQLAWKDQSLRVRVPEPKARSGK
jgi:hypothetical protein